MGPFRARTSLRYADEWEHADLLDRAEKAEADLALARDEIARLQADLRVSRLWVTQLVLWLDDPDARARTRRLPKPGAEILAPETRALLRSRARDPLPLTRILAVSGLVALPWTVLAAVAYLVWLAAG